MLLEIIYAFPTQKMIVQTNFPNSNMRQSFSNFTPECSLLHFLLFFPNNGGWPTHDVHTLPDHFNGLRQRHGRTISFVSTNNFIQKNYSILKKKTC